MSSQLDIYHLLFASLRFCVKISGNYFEAGAILPMKMQELRSVIDLLEPLRLLLSHATTAQEKDHFLSQNDHVVKRWSDSYTFDLNQKVLIKALIAIGQAEKLLGSFDILDNPDEGLYTLLEQLQHVEEFYSSIGGIVGYHVVALKLIDGSESATTAVAESYSKPPGVDLCCDSDEVRRAVRCGLESTPLIAEIYPVGGAGDRLNLRDEQSGVALPAAELPFAGHTLLEGLIRDLQAREYLYFKISGEQLITPIVMMTSREKDNHHHILAICEQNQWFGRPKESFFIFEQPLVPLVTKEGGWATQGPLKLMMKPGGHGVLWKLAKESGAIDWLKGRGYTKALVRQINNPVSGIDYGLIAFCGVGIDKNKAFGFASCPRLVNAAEGMNVLVEREVKGGFECGISNVEYTVFASNGIADQPESAKSRYSLYPSNTNILFIDLDEIARAVKKEPLPGLIINLKSKVTVEDSKGNRREVGAGRLETTMQNIADAIVDFFPGDELLQEDVADRLRTFITYNERSKTIATTKKEYSRGSSILETPEGCFYTFLSNWHVLLKLCGMNMPELPTEDIYTREGPDFLLFFHPALGPLWSVIAAKIRGGKMGAGSELQLEITELYLLNLELQGSLLIFSRDVVGSRDESAILRYGDMAGKCVLENVTVRNRGIDRSFQNVYWKNEIRRHDAMAIRLSGCAEFYARNVIFDGPFEINIPDGERWTAYQQPNGKVTFAKEKISQVHPLWHYHFSDDNHLKLVRCKGTKGT